MTNLEHTRTLRLVLALLEAYPNWRFTSEEVAVATGLRHQTALGCLLMLKQGSVAYYKGRYFFKGYEREEEVA